MKIKVMLCEGGLVLTDAVVITPLDPRGFFTDGVAGAKVAE